MSKKIYTYGFAISSQIFFYLNKSRYSNQYSISAKAIDLLAWYISSEGEVDAVEMHEPYTYLNGLNASDLEDLLEDIKVKNDLKLKIFTKRNNIHIFITFRSTKN